MRRGNARGRATHRAARLSIVTTLFRSAYVALPSGGTNRVTVSRARTWQGTDDDTTSPIVAVTSVHLPICTRLGKNRIAASRNRGIAESRSRDRSSVLKVRPATRNALLALVAGRLPLRSIAIPRQQPSSRFLDIRYSALLNLITVIIAISQSGH